MKKLLLILLFLCCYLSSFSQIVYILEDGQIQWYNSKTRITTKCDFYGTVYIETDQKKDVDFTITITKNPSESQISLAWCENPCKRGQLKRVYNRDKADFVIRIVPKNGSLIVDFTKDYNHCGGYLPDKALINN